MSNPTSSALPPYSSPPTPNDVLCRLVPSLTRHNSDPLFQTHLHQNLNLSKDSARIFCFGHGGIVLFPLNYHTSEAAEDARDSRTTGYFQVVSTTHKMVRKIVIRLIARQMLDFMDMADGETDEVFSKSVELGGGKDEGIVLEKGVNTFEFSISIPSSTCVRLTSSCARISHFAVGTVVGSSKRIFGRDLHAEQEIWLMTAPSASEEDDEAGSLNLDSRVESFTPQLGPYSLNVSSSRLVVGGPIYCSLTLHSPPPHLAVYAVGLYVAQTARVKSFSTTKSTVLHLRALPIFEEGADEKPFNVDRKIKASTKAMMPEGQSSWTFEKFGRLPSHNLLQPATHRGTVTCARFVSELILKIYYTRSDPEDHASRTTLFRNPLLKRQVPIASCGCLKARLSLPNYSEDPSASVSSLVLDEASCECNELWEPMRDAELALHRPTASRTSTLPERSVREEEEGYLIETTRKIGETFEVRGDR